ncbi:hypothetical protein KTH71_04435 [Acinetobacter sp. WU_MDCI_Axc73]|nr:hypothetical protein [Acinetobacter sp. WU_MDCI_Axc73]
MNNCKIRVNNEAESREAQELFFELGYRWKGYGLEYIRIGNYTFITAYPDEMLLRMGWGGDTDEEITLPQLRGPFVLHRNDLDDANFISEDGEDYYLKTLDGWYVWDLKWERSENDIDWFDNNVKPIQKFNNDQISGADALRALADGKSVLMKDDELDTGWLEICTKIGDFFGKIEPCIAHFLNGGDHIQFKLKPQTIKIELEIPKPFVPKEGDRVWCISPDHKNGYTSYLCSRLFHTTQFGAWRTEAEVKIVVEQARKIKEHSK